MNLASTATDAKELAKLRGMTEWFMPKEIDEMQKRIFTDYRDFLSKRGETENGNANRATD